MSSTYTIRCRRCGGTGAYEGMTAAGRGGVCFGCMGSGRKTVIRYTAEEKAAMQQFTARVASAREQVKARSRELGGRRNSDLEWSASYGFGRLRDEEPERFERMLASVEAGRLDAVIHHLAAYYDTPRAQQPGDPSA